MGKRERYNGMSNAKLTGVNIKLMICVAAGLRLKRYVKTRHTSVVVPGTGNSQLDSNLGNNMSNKIMRGRGITNPPVIPKANDRARSLADNPLK